MLQAAAKNYFFTGVVVDPADYPTVASELTSSGGMLSLSTRLNLAAKGFVRTAAYEAAIARYFAGPTAGDRPSEDPSRLSISLPRAQLQAMFQKVIRKILRAKHNALQPPNGYSRSIASRFAGLCPNEYLKKHAIPSDSLLFTVH